jgi:hypothetical protein
MDAYIDIENAVPGTITGTDADVSIIKHENGIEVLFEFTAPAGANTIWFYSAEDDGDITFTGDGSTITTFMTGFQVYEGTIADYRPYVKTTTTAQAGEHEFRLVTETPQEYRDRLGLRERVVNDAASGIWETPVVGYEYLDGLANGKQAYVSRYAATITVAGTQVLDATPSITAVVGQSGSLTDAGTGDVMPVGTMLSAATGGGVIIDATNGLELRLGTDFDEVGDSYDIYVRGTK